MRPTSPTLSTPFLPCRPLSFLTAVALVALCEVLHPRGAANAPVRRPHRGSLPLRYCLPLPLLLSLLLPLLLTLAENWGAKSRLLLRACMR